MKEKILKTAVNMLSRYGIKWVNMAAISKELGISKKTLYKEFESKDELVAAVVEQSLSEMWDDIAVEENNFESQVKLILQISLIAYKHASSFCPAFYEDIRFFHQGNQKIEEAQERLKDIFLEHFESGVQEGVFIAGENYNTISMLFAQLVGNQHPEFQATLMLTLLRGVCSPKGADELRNYGILTNNIIHQSQYMYNNG